MGTARLDSCMEPPAGMNDAHGGTTVVGETFQLPPPGVLDSPGAAKVAGRWRALRAILSWFWGDGNRVRMASLARGRAAPVRRRGPGPGGLAAERGRGVAGGGGRPPPQAR